jgi:hypothetical protein
MTESDAVFFCFLIAIALVFTGHPILGFVLAVLALA